MLILSRKIEESIVIGDDVMIKIVSIDRGNVKIGIEAPSKTLILRAELKEAIQEENKKAIFEVSEDVINTLSKHIKH